MSSQIGTPMRTPEKTSGPGSRAGAKDALLVEHAVVRQVDLEPHRFDPSARKQRRGVVERAVLDPWQADQHRRAAVGGLARQRLAGAAAGLLERRLEHEVFGRIAGEIELRRHDEPGAESGGFGARFAQPLQIAVDVADDRGNLRERDDEAIGGSGHGRILRCRCARRKPLPRSRERSAIGRRKTPVASDGLWRRTRGRGARREIATRRLSAPLLTPAVSPQASAAFTHRQPAATSARRRRAASPLLRFASAALRRPRRSDFAFLFPRPLASGAGGTAGPLAKDRGGQQPAPRGGVNVCE